MNHSQEQTAVIQCPSQYIVCLAGAGSGKTAVQAARVRNLIDYGEVRPEHCIAITFTTKAGRELRERIGLPLYHSGTIHALSLKECHKWGVWQGTPSIMQEDEAAKKILALATDLRLQKKVTVTAVCEAIASGVPLEGFGDVGLVAKAFRRHCLRENTTTMDVLLHFAVKHLAAFLPPIDCILWDEFQDSGPGDMLLLAALEKVTKHMLVTGDPSQSIFGFRGARVKNILDLQQRHGWTTLKLTNNYRSGWWIVEQANRLASPQGIQMLPARECRSFVDLKEFDNETAEIGFLRQEITRAQADNATLAILCRHNALVGRIEGALIDVLPVPSAAVHPPQMLREAIGYCSGMANYNDDLDSLKLCGNAPCLPYIREFWAGTFLDTIAALSEALDATDEDAGQNEKFGNVTIGTVHSVKGLEFSRVIVVGVEANLWPGQKRNGAREEEQRILYVAATRARDELTFTHCRERRNLYTAVMETCNLTPFLQ